MVLKFQITQHGRDEQLMRSLVDYLDCGNATVRSDNTAIDFLVTKFSDIENKIIPFFGSEKYPIVGAKALDFADFYKAAELMKSKAHLTASGLEQIRVIKAGMNTGRSIAS